MKKVLKLSTVLVLALLCSCAEAKNTATEIYFDTAVTLTADCSDDVLAGAFLLCKKYEDTLSRTKKDSEVSLLASGKRNVGKDTLSVIKKGLAYSEVSSRFDITVAGLTDLWDFKNEVVPTRDEIAEALKNVDYQSVEITGNTVDTHGKKIDLGGIAKGYISDKLLEYFEKSGAESGIINLGGNVTVFGDEYYSVGIKKPFSENSVSATLMLKNKSVSTSGIYERCFTKDGKLYHHILDAKTGYPAETDLLSASVIGDVSADCDALATVCILSGLKEAKKIIDRTEGFEAIFIDGNYDVSFTDGFEITEGIFQLKS